MPRSGKRDIQYYNTKQEMTTLLKRISANDNKKNKFINKGSKTKTK
jgi:hypothetical protein